MPSQREVSDMGGTMRLGAYTAKLRPGSKVSQAYGVFNEELGRPERAIVVVDGEGICRYIDVHTLREVPDEEEIVEELKKLD